MRKSEIEWLRFKAVLTGDTLVEYQVHWTIKDIKGQERNYCCYFLELEQADNFFVKKLGEKNTRHCLVLKRTLSPNESPSVRVETMHGLAYGKFYPNEQDVPERFQVNSFPILQDITERFRNFETSNNLKPNPDGIKLG